MRKSNLKVTISKRIFLKKCMIKIPLIIIRPCYYYIVFSLTYKASLCIVLYSH